MVDLLDSIDRQVEIDDISFAQYLAANDFLTKRSYIDVKLNNSFCTPEDTVAECEELIRILKSLKEGYTSLGIFAKSLKENEDNMLAERINAIVTNLVNIYLNSIYSKLKGVKIDSFANDYFELVAYANTPENRAERVITSVERLLLGYIKFMVDNIDIVKRERYVKVKTPIGFKIYKINGYKKVHKENKRYKLSGAIDELLPKEAIAELDTLASTVVRFIDYSEPSVSPYKVRRVFYNDKRDNLVFSNVL